MGDVIIDGGTGVNRLVVLDANGKIPALDGSAVINVAGANFSTGTIPTARLDTGTTAGKIVKLDGNAKLPAVSGAALTGVAGATKSSSDPAIDTNPSGGVGTEWQNTTSGEVYICTDATAGKNVWTNVGGQSGNIGPYTYAGKQYGYSCGGYGIGEDVIEKFSYTSDGDSTDVGNLTVGRGIMAGQSSTTYGHQSGGMDSPTGVKRNVIDRFSFASDGDATDWGDLLTVFAYSSSCTDPQASYGYVIGNNPETNVIQRYSFDTLSGASDVGNLTTVRKTMFGVSDGNESYGYSVGGSTTSQSIERFAFASSSNASNVGDLVRITKNAGGTTGHNSESYGFVAANNASPRSQEVQRFAFASSSNATDWSNITAAWYGYAASSSTTHGYAAGGWGPDPNVLNVIEKYPFATQTNATDVGDLLVGKSYNAGNQY